MVRDCKCIGNDDRSSIGLFGSGKGWDDRGVWVSHGEEGDN